MSPRALALVLLAGSAAAEPALSLANALEQARRTNLELQAATARLDQSAAAVDLFRAALLPQASLQARYTHNSKESSLTLPDGAGTPPPTRTLVVTRQNQLDGLVQASVPLVSPASWGALRAADQGYSAQQASREAAEVAVMVTVAQAFYLAAGTDEALVARRHAVEVARRTAANARAQVELGTRQRVDGTRAELALIRAEQAAAEADELRARAYRALATLISRSEPFTVVAPEVVIDAAGVEEAGVAEGRRPDLLALERSAEASSGQAFAAALRWAPTLSAFGNVRPSTAPGLSGEHAPWAIGVQLDWVLYDGGSRDATRRAAEAAAREAQLRAEQLSRQISDEIANANAAVALRRSAIAAARRGVDLAAESLELISAQQQGGRSTQLELLEAQDALVTSELALSQSRLDLGLAQTELKRATGELK